MTRVTLFLLLISLPVLLVGCASGGTAEDDSADRVGMHIDAMFEFAIEYPLDWTKTRQQNRDEQWGEVRWSHPDNAEIRLVVHSLRTAPNPADAGIRFEQICSEYPTLEITLKEEIELQERPALHFSGYTPQHTFDMHILEAPGKVLTILYAAPPGLFSKNLEVLEEALDSFIVLGSNDAAPQAD